LACTIGGNALDSTASNLLIGLGAIGAALLGELADLTSIVTVYQICAVLPLVGLLALWLPKVGDRAA
jgi:hypothetical protein